MVIDFIRNKTRKLLMNGVIFMLELIDILKEQILKGNYNDALDSANDLVNQIRNQMEEHAGVRKIVINRCHGSFN
jgi:hypothetical protein